MVTFTFFKFEGFKNRWWAFTQMGLRPFKSGITEGLTFAKMVGTGSGNGFSIKPDFGQYGWLGVWETEEIARDFFKQNALFQAFTRKSTTHYTVYAQPVVAHGKWDGVEPFKPQGTFDADKPVAVLTRATIKTNHLWNFWRYVPRVSKSIDDYSENRFLSVGIGELPLVQQATFSVWKSGQAMMEYAYKKPVPRRSGEKNAGIGLVQRGTFCAFCGRRYGGGGWLVVHWFRQT